MTPAAFRLLLSAALFVAWLGYLGYLIATRPVTAAGAPLVVSRPQVLTSEIDIIAEIDDPQSQAIVREVLYPANAAIKPGDRLTIGRLADARGPVRYQGHTPPPDFSAGVRLYLVPLRSSLLEKGRYEVAAVPPSPGFHTGLDPLLRIYPATAETLAQYRGIAKPRH